MNLVKKGNAAWALAKKISRRKYSMFVPVELVAEDAVKVRYIIYGNEAVYNLNELYLLAKR